MHFTNTFEALLPKIDLHNFNDHALALFRYQAEENLVYRSYLEKLNVDPHKVVQIYDIPFLPIDFYKDFEIKTGEWKSETIFKSSGTTATLKRSKNYVKHLDFYHEVSRRAFEKLYGSLSDYVVLALLPSYLEQGDSSLIAMADYFINHSAKGLSSYLSPDPEEIRHRLLQVKGSKVLLLGVAYALLDLAEYGSLSHPELLVMETGGMKGRKKEITREELHKKLQEAFSTTPIYSEYGMTELMSQAYGPSGSFRCPPWMKVLIREVEDPFTYQSIGKSGGINIIDLANIHTCAFIETKDLGSQNKDGSFAVLGRFDNSEARGCNLLIA